MYTNCKINIKSFTGTTQKALTTLASGVLALITPTSNSILTLYPDLPVGQSFSFCFISDTITKLTPESEITIAESFNGEVTAAEVFICVGDTRRNKVGGQYFITGNCVRKDG